MSRRKLTEEENRIKGSRISDKLRNSQAFKEYIARRKAHRVITHSIEVDGKLCNVFKASRETWVDLNPGQVQLYKVLAEKKIGRKLLPGEVVHHRDLNHYNNDITNLEVMTISEHMSIHKKYHVKSEETKKKLSEAHKFRNPESYKRQGEKLRGRHQSEELRRQKSETMKANIAKRRALGLLVVSEEQKKKISESVKLAQQKMREQGLVPGSHIVTEEYIEKQRLSHLGKKASEETKQKMRDSYKATHGETTT